MDDNEATEVKNNNVLWMSHALVAVITVVILVVLLALQPWSGSSVTEVNSFRMSMFSSIAELGMSQVSIQEIQHIAPDRSHIILNPEDESQGIIIIIGEDLYANDERYVAGYQSIAIATSLATMVPSEEHTKTTFEQLTDVEELSVERIDGVTCRHYKGRIDLVSSIEEQIDSLDPEQPNYDMMVEALSGQIEIVREIKTRIDVWVGKDDGFVRQIRYEAQMPSEYSESPTVSISLITYYDINKSITIEPPLDSAGELLPGWFQASS